MRGWVWAAVPLAVAVLIVVDRLVARLPERDGARRGRARRRPGAGGAGPFGELVALFQPGARHLHEESERRRQDLVAPGAPDPRWTVDLDAGTAVVPGPVAHACNLVPVAPGVWTTTSQPWSSLTTLVVAPDRTCLVVDPNIRPADLTALVAEVRAHGWTPVAGFSTHPHWDHVLWPAEWSAVTRWATPEAARTATLRRRDLAAEAEEVTPGHDHRWTGLLTGLEDDRLPWDGPTALVVPYPGHCPGSAALWLPTHGVLVSGDMLSDVEIPLLADPGASEPDPLAAYRASLDLLADLEARVLVPGHGTVADHDGIQRRLAADRGYLDRLVADAHAGSGGPDLVAGGPDAVTADPRLADPEQAEHHARQVALVARLPGGG